MPKGPKVSILEQRRRDLKGGDPIFYQYISLIERAKALDSAGDIAGGQNTGGAVANILWRMGTSAANMAKAIAEGVDDAQG